MKNKTYFIIDAGNTRIKMALFEGDHLEEIQFFPKENLKDFFAYIGENKYDYALLSSVLNSDETQKIQNYLLNCTLFSEAKIPIKNAYETPKTLGSDRLANAVSVLHKAKGNRLVIDVGTCLKFDFVDENDTYLGGSISPGIKMRYKALHEFTGNLPQLELSPKNDFIGTNTNACLHSGVMNGIQEEINGFIQRYEEKYQGLTIFVTGGDHLYFDYCSKNSIFADENLTLFGLLQILKANVE